MYKVSNIQRDKTAKIKLQWKLVKEIIDLVGSLDSGVPDRQYEANIAEDFSEELFLSFPTEIVNESKKQFTVLENHILCG